MLRNGNVCSSAKDFAGHYWPWDIDEDAFPWALGHLFSYWNQSRAAEQKASMSYGIQVNFYLSKEGRGWEAELVGC